MTNNAITKGVSLLRRDGTLVPLAIIFALSCYLLSTVWLLFALPAVFLMQKSRKNAWVFILVFYLVLNIEEIPDAMYYFDITWVLAVTLWALHALLFSSVWLPFYKHNPTARNAFVRTLIFTVILILPPLGLLVWMQPIAASGVLFPGMGWSGIGLSILLMSLVSSLIFAKEKRSLTGAITALFIVAIVANLAYRSPTPSPSWITINTHFGGASTNTLAVTERQAWMIQQVGKAMKSGKKLIVLPENVTEWLSGTQMQWASTIREAQKDKATILIGRTKQNRDGTFDGGFEVLGGQRPTFLPERMPMPLGEWRPWYGAKDRYNAHWLSSGASRIQGVTAAYLICYEQMVPYPLLWSFLSRPRPSLITTGANQWFAVKSSYVKQKMTLRSFARLFKLPILVSTNFGVRASG